MARILYSLAQDGRGHSSRGYEIIRRLAGKGHQVMVLTGGDTYEPLDVALKGMNNVSLHRLPGLRSIYGKGGKINYAKTATRNFSLIISGDLIVKKLEELISNYRFDFAISDFEPFLPRAAKKAKLPFITIDNQHKIMFGKMDHEAIETKHLASYLVTQGVVRSYHPFGKKCIIASVFKPKLRKKNVHNVEIIVVGPLIRDEVEKLRHKVATGDFVLVYVKPVLEKTIVPLIKKINDKFIMYVKDPSKYKETKNVSFRTHSAEKFAEDLARCKAVVSSAGEQLMSEALYLGKPLFVMPEGGTFEQTLNGYSVKEAKVGDFKDIYKMEKDDITAFLGQLETFRAHIAKMRIKNSIPEVMKIIYSEMKANKIE
jgi:uncharacterized protein (TIGR00661 family)